LADLSCSLRSHDQLVRDRADGHVSLRSPPKGGNTDKIRGNSERYDKLYTCPQQMFRHNGSFLDRLKRSNIALFEALEAVE
jgi:hypothetical protein